MTLLLKNQTRTKKFKRQVATLETFYCALASRPAENLCGRVLNAKLIYHPWVTLFALKLYPLPHGHSEMFHGINFKRNVLEMITVNARLRVGFGSGTIPTGLRMPM